VERQTCFGNQPGAYEARKMELHEDQEGAADRAAIKRTSHSEIRRYLAAGTTHRAGEAPAEKGEGTKSESESAERVCSDALAALADCAIGPAVGILVQRWRDLVEAVAPVLVDRPGSELATRALAQMAAIEAAQQHRFQAVCAEAQQRTAEIADDAPDAADRLQTVAAQANPWLDAGLGADGDQVRAAFEAKRADITTAVDARSTSVAKPDHGGKPSETRGSSPELAAARTTGDSTFDDVVARAPKMADAPSEITLPRRLVEGMQGAWDDSLPDGRSQEQAGILVRDKEGRLEWRRATAGLSGSAVINYGDLHDGEALIAAGHTHPYDEDEGGHTDVAFSGADLARLVWVPERVHVVQAGNTLFMVVKTAEFDEMLVGADASKRDELRAEIAACWDGAFRAARGRLPARAEAAVKITCRKYHLAYYRGTGGKVRKA
jgi:hypothetical protein